MHSPLSIDQITTELKKKGVRPSYQRLKVLEYLHKHPGHPTAEEIFTALSPEIPTLSRTTIYNNLHTFVSHGLVHCLSIDGVETLYDIMLESHGHFKCDQCSKLMNFQVDVDQLTTKSLDRYHVRQKSVLFYGLCPECVKKNQNTKGGLI